MRHMQIAGLSHTARSGWWCAACCFSMVGRVCLSTMFDGTSILATVLVLKLNARSSSREATKSDQWRLSPHFTFTCRSAQHVQSRESESTTLLSSRTPCSPHQPFKSTTPSFFLSRKQVNDQHRQNHNHGRQHRSHHPGQRSL
jgi:hypothetical protein